jgi:hypothetical protein
MSEELRPSIEASWRALWQSKGVYELASGLKTRRRVGLTWFRPLGDLALPDTGPVVVLNRDPWGVVSVDLKNSAVSQLHTIQPIGFEYNAVTNELTAKVKFRELKYAGDYETRRGQATASALKLASKQMRSPSTLAAAADPNDPISQAKAYQDKLATQAGPNGNTMLNTYYQYNDQYSGAFDNKKFAAYWAAYKTDGQTTQFYANQTSTAATPGNTGSVPVNGGGGSSAYNRHSFAMQGLMVAALKGQPDAAAAATAFDTATVNPANQSQTVDSVMTIVKTTPPTNVAALATTRLAAEPAWRTQLRSEIAPHCDEIDKEADDMLRGISLREETSAPIYGQFNCYFPMQTLTLRGRVEDSTANGSPSVIFISAEADFPDVTVRLGAFPGKLHGDLTDAVNKAQFLKSFLGKRVAATVRSSPLLEHMGRMMTLALTEKLGPRNI